MNNIEGNVTLTPIIDIQSIKGIFSVILKDLDSYFQLFEEYDRKPEYAGSEASFDQIFDDQYRYSSHATEGMRLDHENDRKEYLK
jgi:hypothetical protein